MSDTIQLVPSVPVAPRPAPVRADQHIEPAKHPQAENRTANNGSDSDPQAGQHTRHLTISRHDKFGSFIFRTIDEESGKVLWQYPAENMLRMSQRLQELEHQADAHKVDEKA